MRNPLRLVWIVLGFLCLGLGTIGIVLPILPTVPFYMATLFCFAKSSEKLHNWFIGTNLYKKHLESFVQNRQMTLKQKWTILLTADIMLCFPFFLVDNLHMRIFLIVLVIAKFYYFMFRIETIPAGSKKEKSLS